MSREYPPKPVLAVGALVFHHDEVLLVKRSKEPGLGLWSIPGGVVRLGERMEEAVCREVREETDLEVRTIGPFEVIERIYPEAERIRFHYVIVDYLCANDGGRPKAGSDAEEARWVRWKEVPEMGLTQETLSVLRRARISYERWQADAPFRFGNDEGEGYPI